MSDRFIVAKELAEKDGAGWEGLNEIMKNAYLHNADLVIQERNPTPVESDTGKPIYTCDRCKDKAYLGDKPCLECNPVGLSVEQVHPKGEDSIIVEELVEPEPLAVEEMVAIPEPPEPPPPDTNTGVELKPGEYFCLKCDNKIHRSSSKIGQKHQPFSR